MSEKYPNKTEAVLAAALIINEVSSFVMTNGYKEICIFSSDITSLTKICDNHSLIYEVDDCTVLLKYEKKGPYENSLEINVS